MHDKYRHVLWSRDHYNDDAEERYNDAPSLESCGTLTRLNIGVCVQW
jgi:hypothetical protein